MNDLKTINAQLAEVRLEQSKCSESLGEIAAERFELERNPGTKAARIAVAENDLIEQLARHKFGEPSDVPAAEKALAAAKGLPDDRFEAGVRLRVLTTLEQRHTARYAELHAQGLTLIEQHRAAQVDHLETMAREAMSETRGTLTIVANKVAEVQAIRRTLEAVGGSWTFGSIDIGEYHPIFRPDQNAVLLMANAISNELNAA